MSKPVKKNIPQNFSAIICDSIADGVFTVNKDMIITYFNKAAARITGVPREEAVGKYCFEILRANICETDCALRYSYNSKKKVIDKHINILRADGKQLSISISTNVLKNENGEIVGGAETFRDLSAIEELKKELNRRYTYEDIVAKNHKILRIFDILPNIAESESSVLIQGPSGSGKELFARAIHNLSGRAKHPFIAINCGALPDTLLESELFGYKKGAFTDAKQDKPGRFALAKGGSLFLDEVDSLSPATQVKLLRVLQEKEYEPLGATSPVKSDVRIIAATKANLAQLVEDGKFRDDLYFRLNIVLLELPPLKERRDDIPLLIDHFLDKFNHKTGKNILCVSDEVKSVLMNCDFPGNVRQLENIIEHAFVMCSNSQIELKHLPPEFSNMEVKCDELLNKRSPMAIAEQELILSKLREHNWNKVATAKELGFSRTTLWRKMKQHGLI